MPQFERHTGFRALWFAPSVLLAGFLFAALTVIWLVQGHTRKARQSRLDEVTASTADNLRRRLQGNQDFLSLLAAERATDATAATNFQERAARYVADHAELTNITWVDAEFVVRDVAPLASNKQILGLRLELPEPKRIARLAKERRQPLYTRPFEAIQGRPSFELWVPVLRDDRFLGLLAGVYSVDRLLTELVPSHQRGVYEIDLVDSRGAVIGTLPARGPVDESLVHQELLIPGTAVGLRYVGQGPGALEQSLAFLAFVCVVLVIGNAYALWRLRRDMAARAGAEEALRTSEARHRAIVQTAMDGFWLVDASGRLLDVNDTYCAMSGYTAHELLTMHVYDLEAVESQADTAAHVQKILMQGEDRFESRHRRKDGSTYDVAVSVQHRPTDGGRLVAFVQDITERKQADAMLRLGNAALEAAANAIMITDRKGVIIWANAAFSAGSGYSADEAIGQTPGVLLRSGQHDQAFYESLWTTILSGSVWHGEVVNQRPDGELYTEEMTITPLRDRQGVITHFIAVKQDVTQRKLLEAQLQQAQKLEAVGRLAGGVAHDFNNMLAVILGTADLAMRQVDAGQPLHADLSEILRAAQRSAELTRQLLAFARQQPVEPRVLDLNEIVPGIAVMLRRLIGEDIQFAWEPAATLWPVRMDPSQMDQILTNLCVNARAAIANVGTVTIATANRVIDAGFCATQADAVPGEYVRLTVRDTGNGMDAATRARIFEPFFTTKGIGEGTGLGLATVYGAVRQNGGFITVDSVPSHGTTFDIYLPRHQGQETPARRSGPSAAARDGHETILLVEDEPAMLRLTTRVLESLGYTVLGAAGPAESLRLAAEHPGEIHLLLSDVVMPEMNGRDLASALLLIHPKLKQLFMSGYTGDVISDRGLLIEGVPFIQKPFKPAALAAKLRDVLDGESDQDQAGR